MSEVFLFRRLNEHVDISILFTHANISSELYNSYSHKDCDEDNFHTTNNRMGDLKN